MKLDYSLTSTEDRIRCVEQVLAETPSENLNSRYLSYMSDYILFTADKNQTKKEKQEEHPIVTKNREVTVNKRQISFEEVVSNLENGEDGLYALITNDKNQIMDPKSPITEKDIKEIPGLKENLDTIEHLKQQFDKATGVNKFSIKKSIIETWQQVYILKASYTGIPAKGKASAQIKNMAHMDLKENVTLNQDGYPVSDGMISLLNPAHVSFLLCHYSQLKEECVDDLQADMHFLLLDLENLAEKTFLPNDEVLFDLLVWKVDGKTNEEIRKLMEKEYGIEHNEQYFSTLWRKRIPKMIAEKAQEEWLLWYYSTQEYGKWKTCGRCGETKLAHPMFFSKNTSKDGFYSICKECRSKKK